MFHCSAQVKLFVASNGNDCNTGTIAHPMQSPGAAIAKPIALTLDKNSLAVAAQFINAAVGVFIIKRGTADFKTGFKNVDANVGVTLPALK